MEIIVLSNCERLTEVEKVVCYKQAYINYLLNIFDNIYISGFLRTYWK